MICNHYMKYKEQEENCITRETYVNNYTANSNIVAQLLVALTYNNPPGVFVYTDHVLTKSQPMCTPEVPPSTDPVPTDSQPLFPPKASTSTDPVLIESQHIHTPEVPISTDSIQNNHNLRAHLKCLHLLIMY